MKFFFFLSAIACMISLMIAFMIPSNDQSGIRESIAWILSGSFISCIISASILNRKSA